MYVFSVLLITVAHMRPSIELPSLRRQSLVLREFVLHEFVLSASPAMPRGTRDAFLYASGIDGLLMRLYSRREDSSLVSQQIRQHGKR